MAPEVEHAGGLIDFLSKLVYGSILASLGWIWKTDRSLSSLKQKHEAVALRVDEISKAALVESNKLDSVVTEVSEMRGELKGIASGVDAIQSWIMGKAK